MTQPPRIVDRIALERQRRRARDHDLFLQQIAVDEVKDRLSMVNRTFTRIAVVTAHPVVWKAIFPDATMVADDETLDLQAQDHDLVIHAMCLHWANDPVGQFPLNNLPFGVFSLPASDAPPRCPLPLSLR